MKKMKKMVAVLTCVCFVVSLFTISVNAAVPPSVQIIMDISQAASSKIGCYYSWGAKGPNEFDCSGLAYWCYKAAGVTIPVGTAYTQQGTLANNGCVVSAVSRRVGYLIFYSYNATYDHVSICQGETSIIHASSSKGKVVSATYSSSGVASVCRPCNWFY
ncbi:MAG: NlpC/P60 family protein [Oscillospiraceae bacterium]|jgi:cell wall-associated NlpC family hydrolase|nr:NlpC/P60 family protein [Oscillospiraceae bacterium]